MKARAHDLYQQQKKKAGLLSVSMHLVRFGVKRLGLDAQWFQMTKTSQK
jgi:hypothetical protein